MSPEIIPEDVRAGSPLELTAGHIGCGAEPPDPADPAVAIAVRFAETAPRSIHVLFVSHQPQAEALAQVLQELKLAHAAPPHFPTL